MNQYPIRQINSVEELQQGDWVAFPHSYLHDREEYDRTIEVARVVYNSSGRIAVNFLLGYKSVHEDLRYDEIIAFASTDATGEIKLWMNGPAKWKIVQPNHPTFLNWQERFKDR